LARRFEDGDAHHAKEQIDALASDTRVLGEVIEDLLASATMAGGGVPRVRVDVSAIAEEVRASMAEHAESAGVRIDVLREHVAAGDVAVLGSAAALRRAVTSLVDNALAHEHLGGLITIYVGRHAEDVVVEVRDDGVGIDPETMGTMFTRFAHGHGHTGGAGRERYGIGLALVREIAIAHGGDIGVAQTAGGGATFRLTMPAAS
jgi:signal transduction histidine kinase